MIDERYHSGSGCQNLNLPVDALRNNQVTVKRTFQEMLGQSHLCVERAGGYIGGAGA